jgi:DNA-3-methyladenine glycosylase
MPKRCWPHSKADPPLPPKPKQGQAPGTLLRRQSLLAPPQQAARFLLGKLLVRNLDGALLAGRIVETEAYLGLDDPAAHAFAGQTARNGVLFGPPGHAYVYFIYGMHSCFNVSCEPQGHAGCVLIRALEPVAGIDAMRTLRGLPETAPPRLLTSGPGRLCQAFGITRTSHNGVDLLSRTSPLQLRDDGFIADNIAITPRIGITKAAERPLRFLLQGNACVSGPRRDT